MNLQHNVSLKDYNTFGISAKAESFVSVTTEDELKEALSSTIDSTPFILGGGSNMLLKTDLSGLIIHIALKGIEVFDENADYIWLKVAAGENWHEFVMHCVNLGYGGVENLALIPGNVGTSPVQNIGAYGIELKDTFFSCTAIHRETLAKKTFSLSACKFGYRDSIFKNEAKDAYIITSVTFKLSKTNHKLHTEYGAIQDILKEQAITNPGIKDIAEAVIAIRSSKLPDPAVLGNSGSFFKNPVISKTEFLKLQQTHPEIPFYTVNDEFIKVPAGWLIEQAGFKGKRFGDAGVHCKQALVLVNYDNATGAEIWDLAIRIQQEVQQLFNITIQPEVNIIEDRTI
ncbi:UDP-N-acetylmuramate dehydrogenase [Leeuwenhoekiella polynyae]|uniref:UDP-N-acetylenolpyruvoylglucosamine reductase n=1 Tax=Leeuwenhoekiella polynyae TaxID=1550906 RepID=A0A4Q0PEI0_9FLAO|nr:UDP-N-acetylmuramate dehydrogenase [Leeuwenhoekiella polynyae]RXG25297.1 UDP-N-acetylmuramate dehydrogenase [Leeuwenhoekiella polynyae]